MGQARKIQIEGLRDDFRATVVTIYKEGERDGTNQRVTSR